MAEWSEIVKQIYATSGDPDRARTLAAIADIETDGGKSLFADVDPVTGKPKSTARGRFHFLKENVEWAEKNGTPYGPDTHSQTIAMMAKMGADRKYAANRGLTNLTPAQEYMLHFQGGPTGTRLLMADRATPLADGLGPRAGVIMKANPNLAKYKTVGDMLGDYEGIYARRAAKYGAEPPSADGSPRTGATVSTPLATVSPALATVSETPAPKAGTFANMLAKIATPDSQKQSPLGTALAGVSKAFGGSGGNIAKQHEAGMKILAAEEAENYRRAQFAKRYMAARKGAFSGGSGNV